MKTFFQTHASLRLFSLIPTVVAVAVFGFCNVAQAVSIRFLPINEEVAGRKIALQDGKRLSELKDLNPKKRSKAYSVSAGKTPPALVALDRERPNGKPASVEIILAANMKSPLVVILADPESPSGMRLFVIEDGETGFPWGSLRFVNTADKPFMIRCDKETKAVTESLGTLDIAPGGEARNIGLQLFSEAAPELVLYSAVWEFDPNLRKLIFIVPAANPASKELMLEIIPQDKRAKN
ncbi:hypothetical protein HQ447_11510 [bacterium]|nr:hypothetical protein [bacterium]